MVTYLNRAYSPLWPIWITLVAISFTGPVYAVDGGGYVQGSTQSPAPPPKLMGLIGSGPAPMVQVGSQGEFPWSGSDSKDCGQACLQHKSAEELALMTMYQLQVTSEVENITDPDKDKVRFMQITGSFCNESDNEPLDICKKRFLENQYTYLLQLRHAEAENKVNAGKYMSQSGAMYFRKTKDEKEKPKKAQVPYVATVSDLEIEFKKRDVKREDYDKWQKGVHKDKDTDVDKDIVSEGYLQYETKDTDPKKKDAGKITVRKMSGTIHQSDYKLIQNRQHEFNKFSSDPKIKEQIVSFKKRSLYKPKDPNQKLEDAVGNERIQLFKEARRKVVNTVNDAIFNAGIKAVVNYSAQKPSIQLKKNQHIDIENKDANGSKINPNGPKRDPATGMEKVSEIEPSSDNEDSFVTIGWDPDKLQKQIEGVGY